MAIGYFSFFLMFFFSFFFRFIRSHMPRKHTSSEACHNCLLYAKHAMSSRFFFLFYFVSFIIVFPMVGSIHEPSIRTEPLPTHVPTATEKPIRILFDCSFVAGRQLRSLYLLRFIINIECVALIQLKCTHKHTLVEYEWNIEPNTIDCNSIILLLHFVFAPHILMTSGECSVSRQKSQTNRKQS